MTIAETIALATAPDEPEDTMNATARTVRLTRQEAGPGLFDWYLAGAHGLPDFVSAHSVPDGESPALPRGWTWAGER